jgi:signal transduction histidine kinase
VIEDDGIGFPARDPSDLLTTGKLGLMGMQERSHLLGGILEIHPSRGGGTTVKLTIPEPGAHGCSGRWGKVKP